MSKKFGDLTILSRVLIAVGIAIVTFTLSSKGRTSSEDTICNKASLPSEIISPTEKVPIDADVLAEGWKEVLYKPPDDRSGTVIASVRDGWLHIERHLPGGKMLWHIILAQATGPLPPEVTFKARDDGSKYPSYAVITYLNGLYFIKDDGYYLRCRRQSKSAEFKSCLKPPSQTPEYKQLGIAGYGHSDLVGWSSESQLIVGTGGPNDMSDCLVYLAYLETKEEISWQARATKTGMRCFSYGTGEAFLYDDGELLLAKLVSKEQAESLSALRRKKTRKLAVGSAAPEFNFQRVLTPNKDTLSIKEFEGKVLLLDFWGIWCSPCVKSLPKLHKIYDTYRNKGFIILGVHSSYNCDELDAFLQKHTISYPVAVASEEMEKDYGITAWPTYILVDRQGKIISVNTGALPKDKQIKEVLQGYDSKTVTNSPDSP